MTRLVLYASSALCLSLGAWAAPAKKNAPAEKARPKVMMMIATAHSVEGTTSAGTQSRPGTAAADTSVLPLGTRIRVRGPHGQKLGEYLITDTGPLVNGRHIDIYMPRAHDAKQFGKHRVRVQVLEWGQGKAQARSEDRVDRIEGRADQPNTDNVK